jgi:hypothetical protein
MISTKRLQRLAGILNEGAEDRWPSREDEEEWRAQNDVFGGDSEMEKQEWKFDERLPPGMEDDGFNAVVINDIGEELGKIEATEEGIKRAEMLHARLGRAIEALKAEIKTYK